MVLGETPARAGILRLPNGQSIAWRNNLNQADVTLTSIADGLLVLQGANFAPNQQVGFQFNDGAAVKWQFIKAADHTIVFYDSVNARIAMVLSPLAGLSVPINGIKAPLAAFAAGDRYVVSAADGTFHLSALGPAS
jgi:hypothetical protein